MSNYAELKRQAETLVDRDRVSPCDAKRVMLVEPAAVLALIAENERIKARLCVCGTCGGDGVLGPLEDFEALATERDQLKIDNGSLRGSTKRMGEDVSKMQKQLRKAGREITQLRAGNEALRKRIEDFSPFKGAPLSGPSLKCLACGGYHYGMQGLPCPNMRITAQAELPETRSGQIGAALSKGEQP